MIKVTITDTETNEVVEVEAESIVLNSIDKNGEIHLALRSVSYDEMKEMFQKSLDYVAKALDNAEGEKTTEQ